MPAHNFKDITGLTFNRWTVIKRAGKNSNNSIFWHCACLCGNLGVISTSALNSGQRKSCGCLASELLRKRKTTHGMRHTPEYTAWRGMIARCYNKNNNKYEIYGGRGISICDRWRKNFENFFADMGERTSNKHSIDRKNNDGNYEPENCRWATRTEQSRNHGISRNNTSGVNGVCMNHGKWCATIGVHNKNIYLGKFDNIDNAAEARRQGEIKYWSLEGQPHA